MLSNQKKVVKIWQNKELNQLILTISNLIFFHYSYNTY
jgi:hypothetical protein